MRARSLAVLVLVATAARAQAQDSTAAAAHGGWISGISLGVPGRRHEAVPDLFTFGGNFTQLRPGRLGADISLGTMPYALAFGVVPIGVRADVALPIATAKHLLVIPSAGVSGIATIGVINGPVLGANVGLATILHGGGSGVRAGVTWHGFGGVEGSYWLAELGFVSLP